MGMIGSRFFWPSKWILYDFGNIVEPLECGNLCFTHKESPEDVSQDARDNIAHGQPKRHGSLLSLAGTADSPRGALLGGSGDQGALLFSRKIPHDWQYFFEQLGFSVGDPQMLVAEYVAPRKLRTLKWLFSMRPLVLQTKQTHQHDQQSRKSACAFGRGAPPERALQDSSMVAPADVVASAGLDLLDVAEVDRGSGQCRCLTCLKDLDRFGAFSKNWGGFGATFNDGFQYLLTKIWIDLVLSRKIEGDLVPRYTFPIPGRYLRPYCTTKKHVL